MGIRMSGIVSGMDTESIIKELMKAQSTKKTKIQNKITKHEWTQEKWKDLNTKIYALYTGTLNKAKTQGSYLSKKVTSSDETKLTATASTSAVNGTHTVSVEQMAKAQYVTSRQLDLAADGNVVSGNTKLTDLGFTTAADKETMINIKSGDKNVYLAVTAQTTVNDFLSACKSAGLNANYDSAQKRFFLAASGSGAENAFSITTVTSTDTASKNAIRNALDYSKMSSAARSAVDNALLTYKEGMSATATKEQKEAADKALDTLNGYLTSKVTNDLVTKWVTDFSKNPSNLPAEVKEALDKAEADAREKNKDADADKIKDAVDKAVSKAANEQAAKLREAFENNASNGQAGNPYYDAIAGTGADPGMKALLTAYVNEPANAGGEIAGNKLTNLGLDEITYTKDSDGKLTYGSVAEGVALVEAQDSIVKYNGVQLTSSSNSISVNGLTLELKGVTAPNETISINVSKDSQAVYDMVKEFITEYNEVLDAMNKAYNADSARGYEPLTDEERDAMTEEQIEKWETKIKDSLLRRDSTLGSLLSTMKTKMQASVTYNGKSYSLSSFGIRTTDYTEYGKLHIYGNADDSTVSGEKDKLMAAIEEDPEKVMQVLSQIAGGLYEAMGDKMKSTTMSSALTFYNDKQMTKEMKTYKDDLKKMESYLADMEDRYYKQFTAMEKAMAKLNSQANSLASLIGGNTQQ